MFDDPTLITPARPSGSTPVGHRRTTGGEGFRWEPPTPERLAQLLPQYDIESLLGRGGMGAVYKGAQRSLKRPVAIKILPPGIGNDEAGSYVERFKNEAQVMARLMHPGIVGVFEFGETSEGQLYIVMECVDGTDLQKLISTQGKLPPEQALTITLQVCDALQYAHAHGVVHRDIKPANILINREGAVKVADFGLAKIEEAGTRGLTKTGMAMGTPDYVAPETLMLGSQVDGRADIYAVGVMLYLMLSGQIPRGAWHPVSVLTTGVDPRFDQIISKAMQNDREHRYQTSGDIRRDLDVILTTPLVRSARPGVAAGSAPTPKSNFPLFMGLGVTAALAAGAFVMFSGGQSPSSPVNAVPVVSAAPAFPSGQWVKLTQLPPDLRKPDSGVKVEGGWIKPAPTAVSKFFGPGLVGRNTGIRAVARFPAGSVILGQVVLKLRGSPAGSYQLMPDDLGMTISHLVDKSAAKLASGRVEQLVTDMDVPLEFAAVGDRLFGRVNGRLVVSATDAHIPSGVTGISFRCWLRDVEVINLGGLTDAAALEALGG